MNRNLFTDKKTTDWRDALAAVVIGLALTVAALAYFDILTK